MKTEYKLLSYGHRYIIQRESDGKYYSAFWQMFYREQSLATRYWFKWSANLQIGTIKVKDKGFQVVEDSVNSDRVIVCAAMLMKDGDIITGIRHYSPEMRATLLKAYGEGYHKKVVEQGFCDQFGVFLNREDAWKIAEANSQIKRQVSSPGTLYSENLY